MSGVERNYAKIDKVREQLYVTLLLHMSVAISVQACFRPPVKRARILWAFTLRWQHWKKVTSQETQSPSCSCSAITTLVILKESFSPS